VSNDLYGMTHLGDSAPISSFFLKLYRIQRRQKKVTSLIP
jgi:hypothetical protein